MVTLMNLALAKIAIFGNSHNVTLAALVIFKAKDCISVIISFLGLLGRAIYAEFKQTSRPEVPRRWILSLIPAYSESEEQILKSISSLRDNDLGEHRQVMVVIVDGKPKKLQGEMSGVVFEGKREYQNLKYLLDSLKIAAGWINQTPVVLISKTTNCGKKDSLVLCHDLFNYPRDNMPPLSQTLRREIWDCVLPPLVGAEFVRFHCVFCTDADSKLHKGCLRLLAEALARDENAIAAAGTVFVELEPGLEWSLWNLYQQFQVRSRSQGHVAVRFKNPALY